MCSFGSRRSGISLPRTSGRKSRQGRVSLGKDSGRRISIAIVCTLVFKRWPSSRKLGLVAGLLGPARLKQIRRSWSLASPGCSFADAAVDGLERIFLRQYRAARRFLLSTSSRSGVNWKLELWDGGGRDS